MPLVITTPAEDRRLLSAEEMRLAAGLASSDASKDADLGRINLAISDRIALECAVAGDGVHPPTLLRETLVETVRVQRASTMLILARRFIAAVATVTIDGDAVDAGSYEVEAGSGMLRRLRNGCVVPWVCGTVVVTYQAGFAVAPADLGLAASTALQEQWSAANRDPLLKRDRVEGVGEQEFWVGGLSSTSASSAFSTGVRAMLDPYRSVVV
ncbi:hypothetical protein [Xanthobacter sediminis]